MKRQEKAERIGVILDELYPETPIPLDHTDAYTLLVAHLSRWQRSTRTRSWS